MGPTTLQAPIRWVPFTNRWTLVGHWVAVWWLPRAMWGPYVVCDSCNADLTRARLICVAQYPLREDWIREGIDLATPWAGRSHCRACARRFLQQTRSHHEFPLLLTSHDPDARRHHPVTGFTDGPAFDFGRPLRPGWRNRLPRH